MKINSRPTNSFIKYFLPVAVLGIFATTPALAYDLIDLGANVEPAAISNSGVIAGSSNTDQYPATALVDTTTPVNSAADVVSLSTPYGGHAVDINNSNMIAGTTGSNSSIGEYAFAYLYDYDNGTLTNLGTLPSNGPGSEPGLSSTAYDVNDVNDVNQVVGNSWLVTANTSLSDPTKYHAFLWENDQMTDLNNQVQLPAGWILTRATAINENGDIAGVALVDGIEHGFLLTNGTISGPPSGQNEAPVAVASADTTSGKAPLRITFGSSGSIDPDGSIVAYTWNFMDAHSVQKQIHLMNSLYPTAIQ